MPDSIPYAGPPVRHQPDWSWRVGKLVIDSAGVVWRCTVAGRPGTWVAVAGGGASAADAVSFDPTGLEVVSGDDVQEAIAELDAAVDGLPSGTSLNIVDCGGDASTARPDGAIAVYWVNSPTEPVNAEVNDLWADVA